MSINASRLKALHEEYQPESHFFTRKTMRFFGDTMSNYGVRTRMAKIKRYSGETVLCWELYRRKPVKHGLQSSAYFHIDTLEQVRGEVQ